MYCCIFGDKFLLSVGLQLLEQHADKIRKFRIELQKRIGVTPVPERAIREYLETH